MTSPTDSPFPADLCRNGHIGWISEIGWGEPPTLEPKCSCGWAGTRVDTFDIGAAGWVTALHELGQHVGYDVTEHRRQLVEAVEGVTTAHDVVSAVDAARRVVAVADALERAAGVTLPHPPELSSATP